MSSNEYISRLSKLVTLLLLMFSGALYSQSFNDYRAVNTGNWATASNWEVFDGTNWVDASTSTNPPAGYPGQNPGANDVTIGNGVTITISSDVSEAINSVTIGDENGGADTLLITATVELNTTFFTIAYDGFVTWSGNRTLEFPAPNTNFIVENPDPNPAGLVLGVSHGLDETPSGSGGCNAGKRIDIGGTIYSACNGNPNGSVSFENINDGGGNLTANPTANPSPACTNTTIQLEANPGGTETVDNYSWSVITAPSGHTFSSTQENPTDTPTAAGTYTYQLIVEDEGSPAIQNTSTVTVEVESCNKTIITNRRITYRVTR